MNKRFAQPCSSAAGKILRAAILVALAAASGALAAPPADFLIEGGTLYTGADAAPATGDVVVAADRIVYVGPAGAKRYDARKVVDARGKIVAPGFIDAHAHPDDYVRSADAQRRLAAPWLFQGVTTILIGIDGDGSPEVTSDSARFKEHGIGPNLVPYVGFGAVRERVLGNDARAPSAAELAQMQALVAQGMCEGAIGFSTGLFYPPQSFAKTDEVIALAKEAARRGGIYDTHQRDESSYSIGLLNSVKEAIEIGREAALPVHIAHLKALGVDVQGQAPQVIALIEAARAAGVDVTADQYPWAASAQGLDNALLPRWSVDGGRAALLKRLDDPAQLQKIRGEMRENLRRRGGASALLLISTDQPWTGKTLHEMAQLWNTEPIDAALRIIRSGAAAGTAASFNMAQSDIRLFMQQPWMVTSSDGADDHPRGHASFPMKYRQYVRTDKVISLGEFIRSSTGRTADIFRLDRRGYLKADYFADVLVFDPERYAPKADYVHPRVPSEGVVELLINGRSVIHDGKLTGEAPGRVLLHTAPAGTCP